MGGIVIVQVGEVDCAGWVGRVLVGDVIEWLE